MTEKIYKGMPISTIIFGMIIGIGVVSLFAYSSNRSLGQSASAALCEADKTLVRSNSFETHVANQQNERDEYFYNVSIKSRAQLPLYVLFSKPSSFAMSDPVVLEATIDRPIDLVTVPSTDRAIQFGMLQASSSYIEAEDERVRLSSRAVGKFPVFGASQIIQTPERMTTHAGVASTLEAIDIASPRGTTVAAFKGGVVHFIQDGYHDDNSCGAEHAEKFTNVIKIHQDDGLEGIYAHVKSNSIIVKEGDRVETGQPLAQVGCFNTCDNAHLHFSVQTLTLEGLQSIPVSFYYDDPEDHWVPKVDERHTYTPAGSH